MPGDSYALIMRAKLRNAFRFGFTGTVIDKTLKHFLEFPDPNGFKAQLVAVDRKACAIYKKRLDGKLGERGLPAEWSDVIISVAQNSEPDVAKFEYEKPKQEELVDYFK